MNICTVVLGDRFRKWVAEQIEDRNAAMAEKRELMIAMDPALAAKFQASTPSGWSTTKLPNKLSTRPSNQPRLQPDGRPAVRTGFRIAQTKDSVQPGEQ